MKRKNSLKKIKIDITPPNLMNFVKKLLAKELNVVRSEMCFIDMSNIVLNVNENKNSKFKILFKLYSYSRF